MGNLYVIIEPESPDDPVVVYEPALGCYVLGRNADQVDIPLVAASVSRRHAVLFVEEGRVLIQDENSTKGVAVDGKRISPQTSVPIEASNNVMIGEFLLYVTDKLESGVKAKKIKPKIHAQISEEERKELRKKVVDLAGKTLDAYAGTGDGPSPRRAALPTGEVVGATLDGDLGSAAANIGATFQGGAPADEEDAPGAGPAEEGPQDARYTFPPMPAIAAPEQDNVDRFIYRRIKPLFDQLMQDRTGGGTAQTAHVRDLAEDLLRDILKQQTKHIPAGLSPDDMLKWCMAAFMEYGAIQGVLGDPTVTEIMVNSPNDIFIEQKGKLFKSHLRFWNEHELRRVIEKMVMITNRRIDEQRPYQDTRLEDGSRVNVIIRPLALSGDSITIRKFPNKRLVIDDLVNFGSMSDDMARFLDLVVRYRANVIVSGGTGSGKTTLLNVLSNFIPKDERLVSIEDAAELRLNQPNKVTLEARPASLE